MSFPLRVFPWFINHCHNQCHACSMCPYHSDTRCLTGKDRCRISFGFCMNTCKSTVCFATTAYHLNDGLLSWKGICHDWFHLAIGLFVVAIYEKDPTEASAEQCCPVPTLWIRCGLSGHVVPEFQLNKQLVTFCHMLAEEMPSHFGVRRWYWCKCLWGSKLNRWS